MGHLIYSNSQLDQNLESYTKMFELVVNYSKISKHH